MTFVFIIAWKFYSKSDIGEFRIAHLLFIFVSSLSIYLGMSFFNKIHEEGTDGKPEVRIIHGIAAIILVVIPFSISGFGMIIPFVRFFMGVQYDMQPLQILLLGLIFPALANFIRETAVASGHPRVSTMSYVFSILISTFLIFLYHPKSLAFLAGEILLGEFVGLVVLFVFLPFSLLPKIKLYVYLVAGLSGGVLLVLEKIFSLSRLMLGGHFQTIEYVSVYCLFFLAYLLVVKKKRIDSWVSQ